MSEHKFRVPLKSIIDEFSLEAINLPADADTRLIEETEINRPGLQLAGFYEYFNPERIQIVGKAEFAFLAGLDENVRRERLDMLFA
ncbi:MAG: HPr kinase/phosphorylase, partial [Oscillospiraceae bacterium]|nr:HPr kinase/phosphorylase [Oscillospiraceae bacterium]